MTAMKKFDVAASAILGLLIGGLLSFVLWRIQAHIPLQNYLFALFGVLAPAGLFVASLLSRWAAVLFQVGKYGIVGAANFLVDLAILHAIILYSGNTVPRDLFALLGLVFTTWSIFKGISFICANAHSFFWNKFWTFHDRNLEKTGSEYAQFLTVSLVGLLINSIAFSAVFAFRPGVTPHMDALWGTYAAVAGALAGMVWNFLGYKFIVFKR